MTDLADYTATELIAGYARAEFTPVDATEAVLARIAERDPELNAFVLVDPESALTAARESARRWEAGQTLGPGDGVPTSIKDIFLTAGWPTLKGSRLISAEGPWDVDAPCVARLRETGAVMVGKTTTPEFAWKGTTDSLRQGTTGNPWNTATTAGGSSGGSGAAVASGMGPWSVGTDGGGSVRIPASFTGTVALKATYGTVPMYPSSPFGTLAHAGPMARTVEDAARLLDIIAGHDSRDWSALPTSDRPFSDAVEGGAAGLRIAYSPTLGFGVNDPEVERSLDATAALLSSLGAHVERVDPGFADPVEAFHVLWFTGAAKVLEPFGPEALDRVDPGLRAGIEAYGRASASEYLAATQVRMDMGVRMGAFHERFDLLLTPTMPVTAFDASRQAPQGSQGSLWTGWTPYTYPFNMTQQPAISVPCGTTAAGMPVGAQLVAARTQDRLVLRAAAALESALDQDFSRPVEAAAGPGRADHAAGAPPVGVSEGRP